MRVLDPPLIPGLNALFQNCQVLGICHADILSGAVGQQRNFPIRIGARWDELTGFLILGFEPLIDLASFVQRRSRRPANSSHLAPFVHQIVNLRSSASGMTIKVSLIGMNVSKPEVHNLRIPIRRKCSPFSAWPLTTFGFLNKGFSTPRWVTYRWRCMDSF